MNDQENPARKSEETTGHAGYNFDANPATGVGNEKSELPTAPVGQTHTGSLAQALSQTGGSTKPEKSEGLKATAPDGWPTPSSADLAANRENLAQNQQAQPVPSVGRILHYRLTTSQAEGINRRRDHSDAHRSMHRATANGTVIHTGNRVRSGDVLPIIITAVWGNTPGCAVNGQVFLDGNDTLWVTSVSEGDGPGFYSWPPRS